MMESNDDCIVKGWLFKKSPKGLKLWQKRWFILTKDSFYYYLKKEAEKPLGTIPLDKLIDISVPPKQKIVLKFDLIVWGRTFQLRGVNHNKAKKWIKLLKKYIQKEKRILGTDLEEENVKFWKDIDGDTEEEIEISDEDEEPGSENSSEYDSSEDDETSSSEEESSDDDERSTTQYSITKVKKHHKNKKKETSKKSKKSEEEKKKNTNNQPGGLKAEVAELTKKLSKTQKKLDNALHDLEYITSERDRLLKVVNKLRKAMHMMDES